MVLCVSVRRRIGLFTVHMRLCCSGVPHFFPNFPVLGKAGSSEWLLGNQVEQQPTSFIFITTGSTYFLFSSFSPSFNNHLPIYSAAFRLPKQSINYSIQSAIQPHFVAQSCLLRPRSRMESSCLPPSTPAPKLSGAPRRLWRSRVSASAVSAI